MDEFTPGSQDPERRGRVAYERYEAALTGTSVDWVRLTAPEQTAWCHAAEAAFEEGRAFEREQQRQALPAGIDEPIRIGHVHSDHCAIVGCQQ